jgi:hypothetical protein
MFICSLLTRTFDKFKNLDTLLVVISSLREGLFGKSSHKNILGC